MVIVAVIGFKQSSVLPKNRCSRSIGLLSDSSPENTTGQNSDACETVGATSYPNWCTPLSTRFRILAYQPSSRDLMDEIDTSEPSHEFLQMAGQTPEGLGRLQWGTLLCVECASVNQTRLVLGKV